ncbi:pyridoxine/pyridoxamine 5'-phosphate oxidase [bacterium BMS3Abin03]|nr:pyridoxine/pyridoxamine 5'-phosphate oxidase [bacterium BMS3Abin03]
MDSNKLGNLLNEYKLTQLKETSIDPDPFGQFDKWFDEVLKCEITYPNAMVLATTDNSLVPSVRTVLLKSIDEQGAVFFTNYESRKGKELNINPRASLLFFWKELERQVRIEGTIEKIGREKSEEYFHSRPRESQLSAWVSHQSEVIPGRKFLEEKFEQLKNKFGDDEIPLPDFWGGYRVVPDYFEFWQGRENRLHDRICYKKENAGWKIFRLSP